MRRFLFPLGFAAALAITLAPLWITRHLPAVDAPQHLFLVHVLRALEDPASAYHQVFEVGPRFTYVTFYAGTALLASWFGEETALRLWLTLVLGAIPLALLALLRAFGRSPWLALLACPLIYTDGFYWGLFGFQSTLALSLLGLAVCVHALERPAEELRWAIGLGVVAWLLVLTHVAALPLPALGVVALLLLTRSDAQRRRRVLLALLPAALLLLLWASANLQRDPSEIHQGTHWAGSGSLLDPGNYSFAPLAKRVGQFLELIGSGSPRWADAWPAFAWLLLVGLATAAALWAARGSTLTARERDCRPAALLGIALACYFLLPTGIDGYMYMIHGRYAQLAALCAIPAIPRLYGRSEAWIAGLAAALAFATGIQLTLQFRRFERETHSFEQVAAMLPAGARVMHLVVDPGSRVVSGHAVYLHYAALAALRCGGMPSFTFALDASYPVNYRAGRQPPAQKREWRPARFSWEEHARFYDYYLVRGADPEELFAQHAGDVALVTRQDDWTLLRRR